MSNQKDVPLKLSVPKAVMAVPLQGEILPTPDGKGSIGVICGFGWIANDDKSPTMRPVILCIVRGGTVVAFPAEMANVAKTEDSKVMSPLAP